MKINKIKKYRKSAREIQGNGQQENIFQRKAAEKNRKIKVWVKYWSILV